MKHQNKRKVTYRGDFASIILSGAYLARYGFTIGSEYYIDYKYGQITIVKVEAVNTNAEVTPVAMPQTTDRPEYGKQYRLTSGKEEKSILNGHSWAESEVKSND